MWKKRVFAAGMILGAFWLTLEVALRVFGYGDFIIYSPDSELLWLPRPSQKGKTVVGFKTITINGQGLRYPIDLPPRNAGEHRVVAFGDSVTMGWGVDDNTHFSAQLEILLAASGSKCKYRVISAGVNAYPQSLCVRRFSRLVADGHQIDTAILAYSFNSNHERLDLLKGKNREVFLKRVRLKGFVRRFATYNLVIEDWLRQTVYYRIKNQLLDGSWEMDQNTTEEQLGLYVASLEQMRLECEKNRVRLVMLLLGSAGQRGPLNARQTAFLKFADEHAIPIVNMVDELVAEQHDQLFMDHCHPTENGHARIARALLPMIAADLE